MGDKTEARRRMAEAGVPIIPGALEPTSGPEEAIAQGHCGGQGEGDAGGIRR